MTPTATILYGDAWELAATLGPQSIDCIVTSPPYWGLRDYGHPGQFGLERTPQEYVAKLVDLFARLRPALKDQGTLWLNLGDSYAGSTMTGGNAGFNASGGDHGFKQARQFTKPRQQAGLKPKDLVGIPWRVAFALQEDGWYLRSDIIWSKPNPMPESVTDRPTKAHEYVFLLAKSARYYFDQEAVMEPAESGPSDVRKMLEGKDRIGGLTKEQVDPRMKASALTNIGRKRSVGGKALTSPRHDGNQWNENDGRDFIPTRLGRNVRTVWTIATHPYPEAHFATFPPKLIEPCIKAGTSERGVCPECGKAWERLVERSLTNTEGWGPATKDHHATVHGSDAIARNGQGRAGDSQTRTVGWQPSCSCYADPIPATVLDPFAGSGTTLYVARKLGRNSIGFELNEDYRPLIENRLKQGVLL